MKFHCSLPAALATFLVLGGCDQSNNYSGVKETELTGMYCDAKANQLADCS